MFQLDDIDAARCTDMLITVADRNLVRVPRGQGAGHSELDLVGVGHALQAWHWYGTACSSLLRRLPAPLSLLPWGPPTPAPPLTMRPNCRAWQTRR